MFQIIVDGIAWIDSDGCSRWSQREAASLAYVIETQGYSDVRVTR